MTEPTLHVEGFKQLSKALAMSEAELRKDFRAELRAVGGIVKEEAKRRATAHGLRDSGAMIAGIELSVTKSSVAIYETASRRSSVGHATYVKSNRKSRVAQHIRGGGGIVDFPYPIIYEFGGSHSRMTRAGKSTVRNRTMMGARLASYGSAQGSHGQYGPRAFMYPALENKSAAVLKGMEGVLDKLADTFEGAA